MTEERKIEIFKKVLFPPFYPEDLEPVLDYDGNILNFTNFDALHKSLVGTEFTERNLVDLIAKLRVDGVLVKKTAVQVAPPEPEPVNPATTLPHENIPMLQNLRTMIDVQNLTAEDARKFLQPGAPKKEFEERVAYIRKHELFESAKPYTKSKAEVASQKSAPQARALVDKLTIKDLGSSTSAIGGGKWNQLRKEQAKLNNYIDVLVQRRVDEPKIVELVQTEINDLGSSSIRRQR